MTLLKKILNNSLWLLIGTSIGRLAMFLTNIFVARILPQEVFGQFATIRNTISMFEGFISGTIGTTATKHIAEKKDFQDRFLLIVSFLLINVVVAFLFILIILLFSKDIVNIFFMAKSEMINALYLGTLLLFFTTLSTITQSILVGFELFKNLAFIGIFVSIASLPIILYLVTEYGLNGAIAGVALYFFSDFFFKGLFLFSLIKQHYIALNYYLLKREIKGIISFSFPLFLAVVVNSIAFWYARIMLVNNTKGFENIAIFDAAFQWLTIIMIITSATTSVALPMFSKAFGKNDKEKILTIFNINLIVNLGISLLIASIFIIFSKQIMSIYGENYIKGFNILIILSITSIFFTLATLYNRFMMSINNTNSLLIVAILGTISLYLVLLFFGVSIVTLAWAFLAYYFTSFVYYFFVKLKYTRLSDGVQI